MKGYSLRFYMHENRQHGGVLLWEWLLKHANRLGVQGGSAFRSMAGFGRHHVLHEDSFFGMSGSTTVVVEFLVTPYEKGEIMSFINQENLQLFYSCIEINFGLTATGAET